ncbi:MAG: hypothetical protein IIY78_07265 [Clostridia bacterium]|nr:hypothetical protein [Clostridia bacterium]
MQTGKYYRRILYAAELVVLFLIEGTPGVLPHLYNVKPLLLVPLAVSAAAFETPLFSLYFGVFCGLVIDSASGGVMGLTSIIIGFICYYESTWNKKYIKNNIYLVLLYSAAACVCVVEMKFFVFCFIRRYVGSDILLKDHYLMRALYTWAFTPIVYLITLAASRCFRKEKRKIKVKRRKHVPHSQRSSASRRRAKRNPI